MKLVFIFFVLVFCFCSSKRFRSMFFWIRKKFLAFSSFKCFRESGGCGARFWGGACTCHRRGVKLVSVAVESVEICRREGRETIVASVPPPNK